MASTAATHASFLPPVLTFLGAAVIGVPVFRLIGQSAVLGYLIAGLVIGPSGLSLIAEPETARSVSELGVVLLLFIVGLELQVSRLFSLRRDIFGLGLAQLAACASAAGGIAVLAGLPAPAGALVGVAVALSATAIALQMLEERGDTASPYGQRAFAVLLFQDLAIAPILALLPLLASAGGAPEAGWVGGALRSTGLAAAAIGACVLVGRYGLNPLFRLLAASGAREVLKSAADKYRCLWERSVGFARLAIATGTAMLMEAVGLSMAMGAFLAGLLLAESNFRHQLEADIEPFRGILLGLFFMSVGMSIDADLVRRHWVGLVAATAGAILVKVVLVAALFRLFGSPRQDALRGGALLAPAGEFAFVLLPFGAGLGLIGGEAEQLATALAALTMLVAPIAAKALDGVLARAAAAGDGEPEPAADAIEGGEARVLVVGFGRFGQVVTQVLLAEGISVTVIDRDVAQIRNAARFGFRVYYGDGTRLDVLRAAGAGRAGVVCICTDDPDATLKVTDLVQSEFPDARTYVRAVDRVQALALMRLDVDYQMRETFESALAFGRDALEALGVEAAAAAGIAQDVRKRDVARLVLQRAGGSLAEAELGVGRFSGPDAVRPEPLSPPARRSRALSAETRGLIDDADGTEDSARPPARAERRAGA